MVFDLAPGEGYTITVTAGAQPVVTLTPGGANYATANGVLVFTAANQGHITQP